MPSTNESVERFVVGEVADFAKVPIGLIKLTHTLGNDLSIRKPALVFLTQSLRAHIRARRPQATLLVTEIEKADFTVQQLVDLVRTRLGAQAVAVNTALMKRLALCFLLVLSAHKASAQTFADFQVRKAFNGGRDEQQPATVAYVFREDDRDFALVDVAVKHKGIDIQAAGVRPEVLIYPAVEWHRGEAEPLRGVASEFNKLSGVVVAEVYFADVLSRFSSVSGANRVTLAPWIFAKAEYTRNYVKNSNEGHAAALASFYSTRSWFPGADTTIGERRVFKYVPYFGFEHFENVPVEFSKNVVAPAYSGLQFTSRLYVEVFPLARSIPGDNRLVVTAELNNRKPLGGTTSSGSFRSAVVSVDWYFDSARHLAFGVTHDRGELPKANFTEQRRTLVGFRAKL